MIGLVMGAYQQTFYSLLVVTIKHVKYPCNIKWHQGMRMHYLFPPAVTEQ